MTLYAVVNYWLDETYACDSLADAKESLFTEWQTLAELGIDKGFRCGRTQDGTQIVGLDGTLFAEIQELEVDTQWDIETLAIMQEANGLV